MSDDIDDDVDLDDVRLDLSDAEEQTFTPLPAGTYNATLVSGEYKKSQKKNEPMISWTWSIDGYNRKVWTTNMLTFNDKGMTKGKNPQVRGKFFKNQLFTMLCTLSDDDGNLVFDKAELAGNFVLTDILEQAKGAKANVKLTIDTEYDNNKVDRIRRFDPASVDADSDEMPV